MEEEVEVEGEVVDVADSEAEAEGGEATTRTWGLRSM